ncbi:hypothetical protein C8259_24245 [Nocardia nova]|uniref:Uncharacterized protein n=1 Tax=Nocardia nova TaxID=37330 RepID=A0A2T2YXH8_9NOCA|nr:hypothetical protein C8259_24245 [Nocardia nova]
MGAAAEPLPVVVELVPDVADGEIDLGLGCHPDSVESDVRVDLHLGAEEDAGITAVTDAVEGTGMRIRQTVVRIRQTAEPAGAEPVHPGQMESVGAGQAQSVPGQRRGGVGIGAGRVDIGLPLIHLVLGTGQPEGPRRVGLTR